jgi:hypothetical protein
MAAVKVQNRRRTSVIRRESSRIWWTPTWRRTTSSDQPPTRACWRAGRILARRLGGIATRNWIEPREPSVTVTECGDRNDFADR